MVEISLGLISSKPKLIYRGFLRGESAAFVWHFICHTGKQLFVKEIISGEAVYHNRCFGLRVDSYVMPGSTADVSAYRSVKFKFFVLNPTPLVFTAVHCRLSRAFFFAQEARNTDCTTVTAAPVLPAGYIVSASQVADRRMILAGYRLGRSADTGSQNSSGSQNSY